MGQDLKDGGIYMEEYGKYIKGQMTLDDTQPHQVIGDDVVDTDTGEVVGKVTPFNVKEA